MNASTLPPIGLPQGSWREWLNRQPVWMYTTLLMALWTIVCLAAMSLDERTINDVSVWTKPFKFALSLGVYYATLAWFAPLVGNAYFDRPLGRVLVWSTTSIGVAEMTYITCQAALGEASHFNVSTPFHQAMYTAMGIGAATLVVALVFYAVAIKRRHTVREPLILAIVLGLILTFVLGGGFGGYLGSQAGHWVDAPSTDANGTWLFNWTRQGGDLRVAHFFGMHAMQVIPAFALLLPKSLNSGLARVWIVSFAVGYAAFSTATFVQAVNGQPFIAG